MNQLPRGLPALSAEGKPSSFIPAARGPAPVGFCTAVLTFLLAAACGGAPATGPSGPDLSEPGDPESARPPTGQGEPAPEPPTPGDDRPPPQEDRGGESAKKPSRLSPDAQALLEAHNKARATHCARPLVWSPALAATAQQWADSLRDSGCRFEHSQTAYGENLAAGTNLSAANAALLWYDEERQYNYKKPGFSMKTGHFTQMVWAGTSSVGCGFSECQGMRLWVCHYDPPGNVMTMFPTNVSAPTCK